MDSCEYYLQLKDRHDAARATLDKALERWAEAHAAMLEAWDIVPEHKRRNLVSPR